MRPNSDLFTFTGEILNEKLHFLCSAGQFFYGNVALYRRVLSIKNQYSSFFKKKVLIFQKSCLIVKILRTFKISSNCHTKTEDYFKDTLRGS